MMGRFVLLTLAFSFLSLCEAGKFEQHFSLDSSLNYLTHFGFNKAGSLNISLEIHNASQVLTIMGCTATQFSKELKSSDYNITNMCANITRTTCEFYTFVGANHSTEFFYQLLYSRFLYFYVLNCDRSPTTFYFKALFINRNGAHLSTEFLEFPIVYIIFSVVWGLMVFLWWFLLRNKQILFHKYVIAFPIVKVIWSLVAVFFWRKANETDNRTLSLSIVYHALYIICQVVFYAIFYMLSTGWARFTIVLKLKDKLVLYGLIDAIGISLILSTFVSGYFTLSSILLYFIVIAASFGNINSGLKESSDILDDAMADLPSRTKTLIHLKRLIVLYVAFFAFVTLLSAFWLKEVQWAGQLLLEILDCTFFILIRLV
eukprot:TRINITY_DN5055_c0_g1_i1.p1 TRINITY_DN5055_c0_g1~~TRINITY_DN5055_c0_g1_i1.p1  ORF type:complete len:373 (+),score=16.68 TRINITY_DN5055_c0_g1_i1:42-1160(+)